MNPLNRTNKKFSFRFFRNFFICSNIVLGFIYIRISNDEDLHNYNLQQVEHDYMGMKKQTQKTDNGVKKSSYIREISELPDDENNVENGELSDLIQKPFDGGPQVFINKNHNLVEIPVTHHKFPQKEKHIRHHRKYFTQGGTPVKHIDTIFNDEPHSKEVIDRLRTPAETIKLSRTDGEKNPSSLINVTIDDDIVDVVHSAIKESIQESKNFMKSLHEAKSLARHPITKTSENDLNNLFGRTHRKNFTNVQDTSTKLLGSNMTLSENHPDFFEALASQVAEKVTHELNANLTDQTLQNTSSANQSHINETSSNGEKLMLPKKEDFGGGIPNVNEVPFDNMLPNNSISQRLDFKHNKPFLEKNLEGNTSMTKANGGVLDSDTPQPDVNNFENTTGDLGVHNYPFSYQDLSNQQEIVRLDEKLTDKNNVSLVKAGSNFLNAGEDKKEDKELFHDQNNKPGETENQIKENSKVGNHTGLPPEGENEINTKALNETNSFATNEGLESALIELGIKHGNKSNILAKKGASKNTSKITPSLLNETKFESDELSITPKNHYQPLSATEYVLGKLL